MSDDPKTFDDLLDALGHLPSVYEADELTDTLEGVIYDSDENPHSFTTVVLTYRPPRGNDYERVVSRPQAGGLQYGRVQPTVGVQRFWHPVHAPIPVVAFRVNEKSGHTEWWTRTVHPRLVAAGREAVMEHVARWLYHEIHDTASTLINLLQWLSVTREEVTLSTRWPTQMNTEPGQEWDVDPEDRVPDIGDEERAEPARKRFDEV